MKIFAARILYPVKVLGPGDRVGIWLVGCKHGCPECSNPELWEQKDDWKIDVDDLVKIISDIFFARKADGITITGGDPFEQPEALNDLLEKICDLTDDILVYTGYQYEEISEKYSHILNKISVLIDGPYIRERNYGKRLVGSDNQNIIYLNPGVKEEYESYLTGEHPDIQNFSVGNSVISVGIHLPDYDERLKDIVKKKGLVEDE